MTKITEDEWNMLDYFWQDKGDLERWCGWDKFKAAHPNHPIIEAWSHRHCPDEDGRCYMGDDESCHNLNAAVQVGREESALRGRTGEHGLSGLPDGDAAKRRAGGDHSSVESAEVLPATAAPATTLKRLERAAMRWFDRQLQGATAEAFRQADADLYRACREHDCAAHAAALKRKERK